VKWEHKSEPSQANFSTKSGGPLHPYLVFAIAVLLPGVGQVVNNMVTRGAIMVFFMLTLAVVSYHLTTPEHSFIGRHAGGIFIYAISVLDAYRWARYRWELFRHCRQNHCESQTL
jgi:hypothetical protein